jgi:iron complex outermembrane receptor protein
VIDLALSYRFNDYLQFSGGVNNVLDEAYYEHLNRRIIGSASNFYEPGRIFFVNMIVNL